MKASIVGGLVVGALAAVMVGSFFIKSPPRKMGTALVALGTFTEPVATAVRHGQPGIAVAEKAGRVIHLNDNGATATAVVIDISNDTASDGEQGLLGMTYSPDGSHLYLDYTDKSGNSHIDRWAVGPDGTADTASKFEVLHQDQPYPNHNGGGIAFGPDGALYIGFGDGGSGGDPENRAQNPATFLGKILRVDANTGAIEIFVTGVRNPWRFSFDPTTRDMWIGDVGQNTWEEIDLLQAQASGTEPGGRGANLGWKLLEGSHKFSDGDTTGMTPPVWDYNHDGGNCSVTGGVMYRGTAVPALTNKYVFADYCQGSLRVLVPNGTQRSTVEQLELNVEKPVSFGYDSNGEILVVSLSGTVYRLVAA